MRFNSRGDVTAAIANRWLTDDQIIGRAADNSLAINGQTIDPRGFSLLAAGGGKWAATLTPSSGPLISYSNFGYSSPANFLMDIGRDGFALETGYHDRTWIAPFGGGLPIAGPLCDARVGENGWVASFYDRRVFTSLFGWLMIPSGLTPFAVALCGEWVFYSTHAYLIAQKAGTLTGGIVAPAPAFYHDVVKLGNQIRIGYSLTQGDTEQRFVNLSDVPLGDLTGLSDAPPIVVPPPVDPPPPPPEPKPMSLQAPNRQSIVAKYIGQHPELASDEAKRGQIIDMACADANMLDGGAWGRKSRNAQGTDLNTDGMCFKRLDGMHEIYDAITGSGQSSWDAYGPFKAGENGYWVPALPVGNQPPPQPPDTPPPPTDDTVAKLTARVDELQGQVKALQSDVASMLAAVQYVTTEIEAGKRGDWFTQLVASGSTGRSYGHSHSVTLQIRKEP